MVENVPEDAGGSAACVGAGFFNAIRLSRALPAESSKIVLIFFLAYYHGVKEAGCSSICLQFLVLLELLVLCLCCV